MSRNITPSFWMSAVAALLASTAAQAADPLTDAIQAAYAPYRVALYKTNSGNAAEAIQAVGDAQAQWQQVSARFGMQPPAPYAQDKALAAAFAQVSGVYAKAATEVAAQQLTEAHGTLEEVREVLARLRQRNQVVVFSDHMNAYHAAMEHALNDGPALLDQTDGLTRLAMQVGVLDHLAAQLQTQAGATLSGNAEFSGLLKAVLASVGNVKAAVLAQDTQAAKAALGKLKGPYSKLFMKFG